MKKITFAIWSLITVAYIVLRGIGINGVFTIYQCITMAAIILATSQSFSKVVKYKDRDALFSGALGLGTLTVSRIYSLAYMVVGNGLETDVTVSDYSSACAYLFFFSTMVLLLLPPIKWESSLRIGVSIVSTISIIWITYSVVVGNYSLLSVGGTMMAGLCVLLAVSLHYQGKRIRQLNTAKGLASALVFYGILDMLNRLIILGGVGWYWHDVGIALYPICYLWIGNGLIRLRETEKEGLA